MTTFTGAGLDPATGRLREKHVPAYLTVAAQNATYATRGFIDAKVDFGVSPASTATANVTGLRAAVTLAQSTGKPIQLPIMADTEWIDVNDTIELGVGGAHPVVILGHSESLTGLRSTVAPKPIFRCIGEAWELGKFRATSITGQTVLPWWNDAAPTNYRGELYSGEHSAVKIEYPSHGGYAHDIYASGFHVAVIANAWDNSLGAVSVNLMERLRFKNINAKLVAFTIASRGTNAPVYENIGGEVQLTTGSGSPPHVLYLTNASPTPPPSRNITVNGLSCRNSTIGAAIKIDSVLGAEIRGLVGRDTRGIIEVRNSSDITFVAPVSLGDTSVTTLGPDLAPIYIDNSQRVKVMGGQVSFAVGDHHPAFHTTDTTTDCGATDLQIVTNGATDRTHESNVVVDLMGTNPYAHRFSVTAVTGSKIIGTVFRARTSTRARVTAPKISGPFRFAFLTENTAAGAGTIMEYRPDDVRLSVTDARTVCEFIGTEYGWARPPLIANVLDGSEIAYEGGASGATDSSALWQLQSGQATEASGTWSRHTTDRYALYNVSNNSNGSLRFNSGLTDIQVSTFVRLGATSLSAGLALRCVDADDQDYLMVDVEPTLVKIKKREAGAVPVTLATSAALSNMAGRTVRLKAVMKGDRIDAYLEGSLVVSYTLTAGEVTLFGTATRHGWHCQGAADSRYYGTFFRSI